MKVSIITVCYNAEGTIESTIQSVLEQNYPNIEYIIVDGASSDSTMDIIDRYRNRITTLISEPDKGIYDAMNKGIRAATGDIVGTLNADDFYANDKVISTVVDAFNAYHVDSVFADVGFVKPENPQKPFSYHSSREFHPDMFSYGRIPAHPTFYVKRSYFEKLGHYNTCYRIAGDFELLVRFLYVSRLSYHYIPTVLTIMRFGGVSTRWKSKWLVYREMFRACKENGVRTSRLKIYSPYFRELLGLFKYKTRKITALFARTEKY